MFLTLTSKMPFDPKITIVLSMMETIVLVTTCQVASLNGSSERHNGLSPSYECLVHMKPSKIFLPFIYVVGESSPTVLGYNRNRALMEKSTLYFTRIIK